MRTSLTTPFALILLLSSACGATSVKPGPTPGVDALPPRGEVIEARTAPTVAEALAAVCATEDIDGETCAVCPPGFGDPDLEGPLEIVAHRAGSFTAAGADEILVTFGGCTGVPTETETTLMARGAQGLEVIARNTILHEITCQHPKDASGRELIVCMDLDGNQGFNYSNLRLFGTDPEMTSVDLFELLSDTASCPASGEPYTDEEGTNLAVGDVDGDGLDDLTVTYNSARGVVPDAFEDYCDAEMADHPFPAQASKTVTFVQRDGAFVKQ